ncbi:MAG TPA: helix-turn-helix domain-containing protein [Actinoplanes sp.]|jgi:DNA-binding HxlR family transcriptional regulator|nr:helix-turn-helix domain-containing protein [Actinoplanes sp.]
MSRTYDDPCGLARALDVVGERWALLIVRELLLGPKRFTDLRRGLPGASQSVLTQRLGELEQAGVLRRRALEPPASTWAYELTGRGRELEPALLHLSAWGSRTPLASNADLSVDALALAMKTTFDPAAAGDLRIRCELRLDGDRLSLVVAGGRLSLARGGVDDPDAIVDATAAAFRSAIFGNGDVNVVQGDRRAVSRLLKVFPRPTPA